MCILRFPHTITSPISPLLVYPQVLHRISHRRSEIFISGCQAYMEDVVVGKKTEHSLSYFSQIEFCGSVVQVLACVTMESHI